MSVKKFGTFFGTILCCLSQIVPFGKTHLVCHIKSSFFAAVVVAKIQDKFHCPAIF